MSAGAKSKEFNHLARELGGSVTFDCNTVGGWPIGMQRGTTETPEPERLLARSKVICYFNE